MSWVGMPAAHTQSYNAQHFGREGVTPLVVDGPHILYTLVSSPGSPSLHAIVPRMTFGEGQRSYAELLCRRKSLGTRLVHTTYYICIHIWIECLC